MRIFSVYKTKSKTRVSEKTPKLAAKKFLEKKKVGTILYLQEHPSEKVHGPYQKTSDKKIMKGGLIDNLGNCYDINYNGTPFYRPCNKYEYDYSAGISPINRTRSGILSNPGLSQQYDGNLSNIGPRQQYDGNLSNSGRRRQQLQTIPIIYNSHNAKPQINPYNPSSYPYNPSSYPYNPSSYPL